MGIDFVSQYKQMIIDNWSESLVKEYPEFYNINHLQDQGLVYLDFILAIQIPVHLHPTYNIVPEWCKILAQKEVPIVHTVHSTQILKRSLLAIVSLYDSRRVVSIDCIAEIFTRIDTLERVIIDCYWEYALKIIEEKDQQLNELHEDKINLIGKMAASMAHEIRNPLTSIKGFMKLIRKQLPVEFLEQVVKYLDIIDNEFENIQMQITGFLSFSKKRVVEEPFTDILIETLLESVLVLIKPRLISENIDLIIDIEQGTMLHIQKVPMQQVLSNLIINAIDALYDRQEDRSLKIHSKQDENHVYIMVTNNGPEIPRQIREKLFIPFVTNKLDGTGLGLAICKQIMEKNHGAIDFHSEEEYTTFILSFEKYRQ